MTSDAKEEQRDCKTCSIIPLNQVEVLNSKVQEEDWLDPYLRYLLEGVLPTDRLKREKLKKNATRFKIVEEKLFKISFQGKWLVVGSYGKWLCTRDTIGPPYKGMPKI